MKVGDLVKAKWSDGLVLIGKYFGLERGYVILVGEDGDKIPCNSHDVEFEVINELTNEQLENVCGGMSVQTFSEWRSRNINEGQ